MNTAWRLRDMTVTEVNAVLPDDTVRRAHALMEEFSVDQVPIFDDAAALVGVVTRRQLVHIREDWGETLVGNTEWKTYNPAEVVRSPDALLDSVFEYLFENDFVLIAEADGRITGIVTINDVARYLYKQVHEH